VKRASGSGHPQGPSELWATLSAYRGVFLGVAGVSMFINLLMLVSPLYMMQIYDRVLTSRSQSTLVVITVAAVVLYVVYASLETLRSRAMVRIGIRLDERMGPRVFNAIFRVSLRMPKGSLHSMQLNSAQPLRDLDTVRQFATGNGFLTLVDVPWTPVFLLALFALHPLYALYSLVAAVVLFGLATLQEFGTRKEIAAATTHSIDALHFVDSNLRNNEAVEAMGMRPEMLRRWVEKHERALGMQAEASDWAGAVVASTKFWQGVAQLGILALGAYLVIDGAVSGGAIFAANILMGRALAPVAQSVGVWQGFTNTRFAWKRLSEILKQAPEETQRMSLPAPQGQLSAAGIFVVPPGGKVDVLRGVTVEIAAGEAIGIVGPSASGKSTLVRALIGVWAPMRGVVRLDGADIDQYDRLEIGRYLGYLPQDVELFDGTVAENIARLGKVDSEAVVEAAMLAGVHELILHFPEGYDTRIGQGGQSLSGGQRQRIGLARALYGNPRLVVLDEPNSNLDHAGEAALADALASLRQRGTTILVVTHRPNILSSMDKILVLNSGVVEKFGTREEVLAALMRPVAMPSQRSTVSSMPAARHGAEAV
jgi:PrtD family type I secretion system ABC transporter